MSLRAIFVLIAASSAVADAATGGWVKVNGQTYPLTYSYAAPSPNALASEKENGTSDTYLIAVDTQIPDKSFADPFWYSHIRRDPKIHGLFFVIDSKKHLIGGGLLMGSLESPAGIWTSTDFAVTASDAQHIDGAGKCADRRLPDGASVAFDITISAPVWKPTVERSPIVADVNSAADSPQAMVYQAFLAALKAGNAAALQQTLSAEAKKAMAASPAQLAARMKILRQIAPSNGRIVKLTVNGSSAELTVGDGQSSAGTVQFALEAGQWKIRNIEWD